MAIVSTETVSATAAILAALFAGYSGWEARQTRMTVHLDAIESLKQTQRAYVGLQIGHDGTRRTAIFKATGSSPALNVEVIMRVDEIEDDAAVGPALRKFADDIKAHPHDPFAAVQNALLLPGATEEIPLEPVQPTNFRPHKIRIFFGTVTYSDIFHQQHTTHYCIRLGAFCEAGNDAG